MAWVNNKLTTEDGNRWAVWQVKGGYWEVWCNGERYMDGLTSREEAMQAVQRAYNGSWARGTDRG